MSGRTKSTLRGKLEGGETGVTEVTDLYTIPKTNGDAPLPRRAGTRTMLPSSWISRAVKIRSQ